LEADLAVGKGGFEFFDLGGGDGFLGQIEPAQVGQPGEDGNVFDAGAIEVEVFEFLEGNEGGKIGDQRRFRGKGLKFVSPVSGERSDIFELPRKSVLSILSVRRGERSPT